MSPSATCVPTKIAVPMATPTQSQTQTSRWGRPDGRKPARGRSRDPATTACMTAPPVVSFVLQTGPPSCGADGAGMGILFAYRPQAGRGGLAHAVRGVPACREAGAGEFAGRPAGGAGG